MLEFLLNNWFVFNIFSSFCVWIFWFLNKVSVEKKHNKNLTLLFLYINQVIISALFVYFFSEFSFDKKLFLFSSISWLFLVIVYKTRFLALEWLDSSVYFTNFRVISSTFLLFIWALFFKDSLSFKEIIWFIIWIFIFLLLLNFKKIEKINYKKSLFYLFLSIVFITLYWVIMKLVSFKLDDFLIFLFYQSIVSFVLVLLVNYKDFFDRKIFKEKNIKSIFSIWLVLAILQVLILPTFLYALYLWADLWIAYKIQSYSILVPIILSVIIYKEKFTKKRLLAIVLAIISLWFFI